MNTPVVMPFSYFEDSSVLFHVLAGRPWSAFLDSGFPHTCQGRYDIMVTDPVALLTTRGSTTRVVTRSGVRSSRRDPFLLLREAMKSWSCEPQELPFCGGALGYFGYDLGRRIETLPTMARDEEELPEMAVGIYDQALIMDHHQRRGWLIGWDRRRLETWGEQMDLASREKRGANLHPYVVKGPVDSNMSREDYFEAIGRIKAYIRDGDCYQVNFAQRFSVAAQGDPWLAYLLLRKINAAPFSAYLKMPYFEVLSSSPERFLQVRQGKVDTRPIKGTIQRSTNPMVDLMLAQTLKESEKDRAENLMIVDLLRNDLGKVCEVGSVEVPELFRLESYARVHHLVSRVTGTLAEYQDAISLLRACFPGGSITGAPKLRAMEIIEELEPHRRGIYCGAIGYVGFDGGMDTNIAIRTLVHSREVTRLWAGGGIVWDSDAEMEYQETYHKASALLDLLQQMEVTEARKCG